MRLLIMGAPGAGKGTQGKLLASHLGIPAISTGAIFRSHVQGETALGLEVKRLMDAGDFVPDSIVEQIVAERLDQDDAAGGFLLDGFPVPCIRRTRSTASWTGRICSSTMRSASPAKPPAAI